MCYLNFVVVQYTFLRESTFIVLLASFCKINFGKELMEQFLSIFNKTQLNPPYFLKAIFNLNSALKDFTKIISIISKT